jgi:Ala-tRNA(Pro) deacylase
LEAFDFGTPPHGGCAHGFERLLMVMQDEEFIREVQAFPMSGKGHTSVMDAPSDLDPSQLAELKLEVTTHKKRSGEDIYKEIMNLLVRGKAQDIKSYEHEPVLTSEDAARVRDTDINQGAKALVMYGDKKPMMVVLSGSTKADMKAIKTLCKIRDLRMATPDEVTSLTGLPIGAIPPFGSLFGVPTIVEDSLRNNEEIVFNAGLHTKSIKMRYEDWERIEKPTKGNFAKV